MKKKFICLLMTVGILLSLGVGTMKDLTQINSEVKQNVNLNELITNNGPILPEPKCSIAEHVNL